MQVEKILSRLGVDLSGKKDLEVFSPIDGSSIGFVDVSSKEEVAKAIANAKKKFLEWRTIPAPKRGELIRLFGEELRANKQALGELVTLECGKILQEGLGEIQEMIDICEFAVGLSRQLYGLTMPSERPGHRMMETWHPLGVVGVISAFNFPVAVWAWNFALAVVCGNPVIWKPSEKTPITALACHKLFEKVVKEFGEAPTGLSQVVIGDKEIGDILVESKDVALVSATGSTRMGKEVAPKVASRLGRYLLELGGNNAMVVTDSADLDMAVRAIVFSAVGTAGQRCTSLRRLIVHESIYNQLVPAVKKAYKTLTIGNPLEDGNIIGPLMDKDSYDQMQKMLAKAKELAISVEGGERVLADKFADGYYVNPAIVEMDEQNDCVKTETFAPILYVMSYSNFEDALDMHNDVPQGLSSCIFTNNVQEAETFLSAKGSDCGIANVNIGPSGAEIGGAFGGEKETGGGRESGSDAWRNYMRRATNTINYSTELPLAQGIKFDI